MHARRQAARPPYAGADRPRHGPSPTATATATAGRTPLLSVTEVQNTAGNQAAVQMLREGHHPHGRPRQAAGGLPVQRILSDTITPSTEEASESVPDLPAELVRRIGTAAPGERQQLLMDMFTHVMQRMPAPTDEVGIEGMQNLHRNAKIVYKNTDAGAGKAMAVTQEALLKDGESPGEQQVTLTFHRNLFTLGAAALYSTLRHELIHVAQRSLAPDEDRADGGDAHIFNDPMADTATGGPTMKTLQLPMQEIEAHVWELEHTGETGIDDAHLRSTVHYLVEYTNTLSTNLTGKNVTAQQFAYWKAYVEKSLAALDRAAVATPGHTEAINEARTGLQQAYDARAAKAGGTKRGASGAGSGGSSKRGRR
ncbi:hypothetical protein ACH4D3_05895 [Streptomyces sp. NPDC018026]|uniref:hypothetical protein n=1 Tax=Streptomyces sp. NPDC018026 TaxID=3365031 RepID=UPI00378A4070